MLVSLPNSNWPAKGELWEIPVAGLVVILGNPELENLGNPYYTVRMLSRGFWYRFVFREEDERDGAGRGYRKIGEGGNET